MEYRRIQYWMGLGESLEYVVSIEYEQRTVLSSYRNRLAAVI
jgi:hypothetical protein